MKSEPKREAHHYYCPTCKKLVWRVYAVEMKNLFCKLCRELIGPVGTKSTVYEIRD